MVWVYTVLYVFKVLHKEWLANPTTDRMMLRNGGFYLFTGGVQGSQWEASALKMWDPPAAPGLNSDFVDRSVDQQQHWWNVGSYVGGKHPFHAVSLSPFALPSVRRGSFMLSERWHSLLPWFSSAFSTEWDICLEKLKLSFHSCLVLLFCSPSRACADIFLWKDEVRAIACSSYPEKWERSPYKAVVFARDTWETLKGSCLLCSL